MMRKIDVFYNKLNLFLDSIESQLDAYYEGNEGLIEGTELKSTSFANFSSDLQSFREFLSDLEERLEFLSEFSQIEDFAESFSRFLGVFQDFPINSNKTILFWIKIVKKLLEVLETDGVDPEQEINLEMFNLVDLDEEVVKHNFMYFDEINFEKSILIFSLNESYLDEFLVNIHSAHIDLLFAWLKLFDLHTMNDSQFVIMEVDLEINRKLLLSILKLQILLSGKEIKALEKYNTKPHIPVMKYFDHNRKYNQFESIINVLNEYNNQTFLLDKYLKLYHVVESFMYKHKVCVLQAQKGSVPFYIGDFQSLYDKFSSNESAAIKDFFDEVFKEIYDGTTTIRDVLHSDWNSLAGLNPEMMPKIDFLFSSLGLKPNYKYDKIGVNFDGGMFSVLVYKIRNNIVHNKDSEVHFESTNLPEAAKFLLENYFIPVLEKVIFHLIINYNNLVWYSDNKMFLYDE